MALAPLHAMAVNDDRPAQGRGRLIAPGYLLAFALVTSLFFMWAIANNFNDILIKQFQKALDLSRMQSGLVQTAFYLGYFTMALPAGWVMTKIGYKNGILIGLLLYAVGALLFYPAAEVHRFWPFLCALYVIAAGLAFLETAANPFITAMGPAETAAQRLNLAQSFNGFGGFLAPFVGGALILTGVEHSESDLAAMTPQALEAYRLIEAKAVQLPYLLLAGVVLALALLIHFSRFPTTDQPDEAVATGTGKPRSRLYWAVVAQFFYVGAQVTLWSYFINFAQELVDAPERTAAHYLGFSLMGFMIGRFVGTALMRYIRAETMLAVYAGINIVLCLVAMLSEGWMALGALGLTGFFLSIMFPTIFALGVKGLGNATKLGSSLLIMAIIGGALLPPLTGWVADHFHSIQFSLIVPIACFLVVATFAVRCVRERPAQA